MNKTKEAANLHNGHRKRMLKRFVDNQGQGFSSHEILEILLFPILPRVNTNDIAHMLINRFGSLENVFLEGTIPDFMQISGIGEKSAEYLAVIGEAFRMMEQPKHEKKRLKNHADCCRYFLEKLGKECKDEILMAAALSDTMHVKSVEILSSGTSGEVKMDWGKIIRFVCQANCNILVLAHNHPHGEAKPSYQDIRATQELINYIEPIHLELFDHIVIGNGTAYSMAEHHDF